MLSTKLQQLSHSPVLHLEPLHPVVHEQELGALQVPPFGQDVDPKHIAETDYIAASSIILCLCEDY